MTPLSSLSTRLLLLISALALFSGCTLTPRPARTAGQLHQVGLVWLKQPGNQPDQQKVIDAIHAFAKEIPEVIHASIGRTDGIGGPFSDTSYDLCFILTFESEAARLRYNEHPTHQKAAQEVFLPLAKKLLFYRFVAE
ncbi:MAG: Dabb family protein [Verrucomicrobiota bacterium]